MQINVKAAVGCGRAVWLRRDAGPVPFLVAPPTRGERVQGGGGRWIPPPILGVTGIVEASLALGRLANVWTKIDN